MSRPPGPSGSAQAQLAIAAELLIEAGAVLATSLDPLTTMSQVARLTVPRLADLCVIDISDPDGAIREVAVAAVQQQVARELEELRVRHPLDPEGGHPVARVIRSGEAVLLSRMTGGELRSYAQGSEHAAFMLEHDYRSAVVAPLLARGRTLGALSVLRLGEGPPYAGEDCDLVAELARRAALAIDNARLYSGLQTAEQRLQEILVNLGEAITVADEQGQMVFANQAAADLLGFETPEQLTGAETGSVMARFVVEDERGRELSLADLPGRRLFAGERPRPLLVRNVVRDSGEERWLMVRASPVTDPDSGRVLYAVNVLENITAVKRAQLAEGFMAEASRVLSSSMDYRQTLERVARLAVPHIADWCAVDVVGEQGAIERVAVHHTDPVRLALARQLDRDYRPTLDEPTGFAEVIRTGRAHLFTDIRPDDLETYARDDEHLALLREIGATAVIIVPMPGVTRAALGTITLVSSESKRRLTEDDLSLAVRLGRRAGSAVERARLYTERAHIAHILQRSLLPESLPEIPGAQVHALYSAAGELNEVGGDFYDVFEYSPGCWMLLVGDVCGKGPRAAGVTALARHTLRAAAISSQAPTEMLTTLHRALCRQPAGADLCTVCLVTMPRPEPGAKLTVTLAGHQPPLLIDAKGKAEPVGRAGTLLGVIDPIHVEETEVAVRPGHTLLLYTDGVPEAGRPHRQLGEQGLARLSAQAPRLALPQLLAHIEQAALEQAEGRLHDDIAMLALRLTGPAEPSAPPGGDASATGARGRRSGAERSKTYANIGL